MTDMKLWLDLFGVIAEVVLLAYFLQTLLGKMNGARYGGWVVYMLLGCCLWAVSTGIDQAYGRTLCYLLLVAAIIVPFYEGKIWTKIFACLAFVLLNSLLEYMTHGFLMLIAGEVYATGQNNLQDYILGLSISKCLLLIVSMSLAQWVKRSERPKGQLTKENFCLLLLFPLGTIGLLFIVYHICITGDDLRGAQFMLMVTSILLLADIGTFILYDRLLEAAQLEQLHSLAKRQIAEQQRFYDALADKNQALRQWNHEVKNALTAIAGYIQAGKMQEALAYIAQTESRLSHSPEKLTGHIALDAVLDNKKQQAQAIGATLRCTAVLTQPLAIDAADLVIVLANGLDNALEAVATSPPGSLIDCKLTLEQNWLRIVITNPVAQRIDLASDILPTSKNDKLQHGIGLTNVRHTVDKYQGDLKLACDDETFTFIAILANE